MSLSDIQTISALVIGPAGALVLAVVVITILGKFCQWMLNLVLKGKDEAVTYRDQQIQALRGQITRQQDLFDAAMKLLEDTWRPKNR